MKVSGRRFVILPKITLRAQSNRNWRLVSPVLRMQWKLDPVWMDKMKHGAAPPDGSYCFSSTVWSVAFVPKETLDLRWFKLAKLALCNDSFPFPFPLFLGGRGWCEPTSKNAKLFPSGLFVLVPVWMVRSYLQMPCRSSSPLEVVLGLHLN